MYLYFNMNVEQQNFLKKSKSLYSKKYIPLRVNPQQQGKKASKECHLEQLILQKYNFHKFLKTNSDKTAKMISSNKKMMVTSSNMILVSQLPRIQNTYSIDLQISQEQKESKLQQKVVDLQQKCGSRFSHLKTRKLSEYKDCLKRIQMTTTYRGLNSIKDKFYNERRVINNKNMSFSLNQEHIKDPLETAERKRIISYIIEKGFARKRQEYLVKARNQRVKSHKETLIGAADKTSFPIKAKRSVVFSTVATFHLDLQPLPLPQKKGKKQQQIEPW